MRHRTIVVTAPIVTFVPVPSETMAIGGQFSSSLHIAL